MIFKRKAERSPLRGDIVTIKTPIVSSLKKGEYYKQNSATYNSLMSGLRLNRDQVRDISKIFFIDVEFFYVEKESVFSRDIFKLIPIKIKNDYYSYAINTLSRKKKYFYANKNLLSLSSREESISCIGSSSGHRAKRATDNLLKRFYNLDLGWDVS